jgi:hypothetical protein
MKGKSSYRSIKAAAEELRVPAAEPELAYRPLPAGFLPETVFCFKYQRLVASDNTVQFAQQRLQILGSQQRLSYARARVELHERLDGRLAVYYRGECLAVTAAPLEAPLLRARTMARPARCYPDVHTQATLEAGGQSSLEATAQNSKADKFTGRLSGQIHWTPTLSFEELFQRGFGAVKLL